MFRNAYFDQYKNKIHLWETIDGERTHKQLDFVPYVFVENRDKNSEVKSIFGNGVQKKRFRSYKDYKEFCEGTLKNDKVFENFVKPELQFLSEYYHKVNDDDMEMVPLRINIFDIEVVSEKIDDNKLLNIRIKGNEKGEFYNYRDYLKSFSCNEKLEVFDEKTKRWEEFNEDYFVIKGGFPGPEEAEWPIVLISCYDSFDNKMYAFGLKEYTGENLKESWFVYNKYDSEMDLLVGYCEFIRDHMPDVITGWNINRFDFPYIFNRIKNICQEHAEQEENKEDKEEIIEFGENLLKLFSPINRVSCWKKDVMGKQQTLIDIPGVTIIDYCDLYKKYTKQLLRINLESYRLDVVAKFELGKGKLDYSEDYSNLNELYKKNFNMYLDYNIIDNKRVKQIQEKRRFIELVQLLSLVAKIPMKYYEAVTTVIEGIFLTYYRRNGLAAEHFFGGVKEPFDAAYVKEPQVGWHGFGGDVDIKSSYPHGMMTLNMGNETYIGTIYKILDGESMINASEEEIKNYTTKRKYPECIYKDFDNEDIRLVSGAKNEKNKRNLEEFNEKLRNREICIAPNGSMFYTRKRSCLAEIQKSLFTKRTEYKNKMKEWGVTADKLRTEYKKTNNQELVEKIENAQNEYDRFKSLQVVVKLLINSMYGALSVPYYRGYNLRIAEAICAVGRLAIRNGMGFVNLIMNDPSKSKELVNILSEMRKLKAA